MTQSNSSNSQTTQLTPNCSSSAVGSGDVNGTTSVQFMTPSLECWSCEVSAAFTDAELPADINCGPTLKQGLTVKYVPTGGGTYYVLLNGEIVDDGQSYDFPGIVIYISGEAGAVLE